MNKIGFVILNYKTYKDTLELLKNLQKQSWISKLNIYVVDNGSNNESVNELTKIKNFFFEFELIMSSKNIGFAKGNNLGITKAVHDGCEFIICSNSDINIDKQNDFLQQIRSTYDLDEDIAIIAPSIRNMDDIYQNPFRANRFTKKEIIKMKLFYLTNFYRIYYFFRVYIFYGLITYIAKKRKSNNNKLPIIQNNNGYIYSPHGSFLIFTPTFFKYYKGFDNSTFLYCEEFILSEMLYSKNLKCYFQKSLKVLHKESQTTDAIVKNYKEKVKFTLKHTFQSCKYFSKIIKD